MAAFLLLHIVWLVWVNEAETAAMLPQFHAKKKASHYHFSVASYKSWYVIEFSISIAALASLDNSFINS